MKKKVANVLKKSGLPALVVAKAENTTDIMFRPYTLVIANDDQAFALLGGGDNDMHSPIDGQKIEPKAGVSETAANAEDLAKNFVVIAHCEKCDHDTLATKELAAALDGVGMHCMNCAAEMTAEYFGDFAETAGDDEEDDSDSLDVDDDSDSEDDEDDAGDDDSGEEDVTDAVDESEEDEETAGDDSEDDSEEESDDEDADDAEEDSDDTDEDEETASADTDGAAEAEKKADEAAASDEATEEAPATEVEVVAAKTVDLNAEIRVVQASSKRYEVFAGDHHLGYLNLDLASSNVANLATNEQQFRRSVIMTIAKDLASVQKTGKVTDDLNNFGLQLASVVVPVAEAVDKMVAEQVEEATQKVESDAKEQAEAVEKAFEIAMAGLNKGILQGPNYQTEIAKVLARFGVQNADEEAARLVDEVGTKFVKAAQELASGIVKQGPDYARGLSTTIASVKAQTSQSEDPSLTTAAVFSLPNVKKTPAAPPPVNEHAAADRKTRYASMFRNLR